MIKDGEITFVSATEINSFIECPARFMFNSIERIEVPNKIALAGGSSVHFALETNYLQKVQTREDLPVTDVLDAFSTKFDKEVEAVDKADFEVEDTGKVKDSWLEVVKLYQETTAYRIFPVSVEQRLKVSFKGYKYGITGKLDVYDEDCVVIDHKTTSKPYKQTPENYKLQVGGVYPLLRRAFAELNPGNKPPRASRIDYLVRRSPKSFKAEVRNISVPIDEKYFLNVFENVTAGIEAGAFVPNRGHIYCTRRFCKFWNECEKKFGGKVRE